MCLSNSEISMTRLFLNAILIIFLFVISLPLYLTLGFLLLISRLFRLYVKLSLTVKMGKKIEFLHGRDLAEIYNKEQHPSKMAISLIFQTELDFEWIQNSVYDVIRADPRNYSRLCKYPEEYHGFYYWQDEENFDINDHVILGNGKPPSTIKELTQILQDIMNSKLERVGKSPWKLLVFRLANDYEEFEDEKSGFVMTLFCDHLLGDGQGFCQFLCEIVSECKCDRTFVFADEKTNLQRLKEFVIALVYAPTYVCKHMLRGDDNILRRVPKVGLMNVYFSPAISLDRLKKIRNRTGSTISNITISCVTGAIERHFKHENAPLPQQMHCYIPVSLRTIRDSFISNRVTAIALKLPLNHHPLIERLAAVSNEITKLKTSPDLITTSYMLVWLLNQLPSFVTKYSAVKTNATFLMTYIPILQYVSFKRKFGKVFRFIGLTPLVLDIGLNIFVVSLNGELQFSIIADKSVMPKSEMLQRVLRDIEKEIELLEMPDTATE